MIHLYNVEYGGDTVSELQILTSQRDELFSKIREIEASCEGIENENNAKRVQELNLELAQLIAQKAEIQSKLNAVQGKLTQINNEITKLSGTGIDRILEAIKYQRWYFFKNKSKVFLDRNSGILWANLNYYDCCSGDESREKKYHTIGDNTSEINEYDMDSFCKWRLPEFEELCNLLEDNNMPFRVGEYHYVKFNNGEIANNCTIRLNGAMGVEINQSYPRKESSTGRYTIWFPCTSCLVENTDYENDVSASNPIYTEKERLQFTLDLFVENDLWPIFDDQEITELYKKIYFEKPKLLEQLQDLQSQIDELQVVTLLSSEFDYTVLLAKYDITAIDNSIIKYFRAVQQWTDELIDKLGYYEAEMDGVIRDFNLISLKLSKKYEDSPHLTEEENALLEERQKYFQKKFSLGMTSVKAKILSVKKQADDLEYRIDEINNGEDAIHQLALLEKEERASFSFLAENTAMIIKNALLKIEYFQDNHQFVMNAIDIWEKWTEGYRVFKTTYKEDMKNSCEDDGIEQEVWSKWYEDWQKLRFKIEQKIQPMIERGLKSVIPMSETKDVSVPEQLIQILENYKNEIDKFYIEERKGIYQKFVFQAGGDLQDKFETESELYKRTVALQTQLQDVIFNCSDAEDRIFILKWANDLLDIQIDEILDFVADNDLQKISQTILTEFSTLKQKNYNVYLMDAEAYSKEKSRREKEYNSLIFKMRKDLIK